MVVSRAIATACLWSTPTHLVKHVQGASSEASSLGVIDKFTIIFLDGVVDVYNKTRRIYKLLGVGENIGLHKIDGGHSDTQPLRMGAFHWFNKHLKGESSLVKTTAEKFFEPENLKVFTELPQDEITSTIHDKETLAPELQTMLLLETLDKINLLLQVQQPSWMA